jgi:glycosyltransferase involved in cell wall biosynthesis
VRILTVVSDLGPGGTQRAAQNYSVGYLQAGHEVAVLAYQAGGPREVELGESGIESFVPSPDPQGALGRAVAWGADLVHVHRFGMEDPASGAVLRHLRAAKPGVRLLETNVFGRVDRSPDGALIDVHLQLSRWCLWRWRRWARGMAEQPIGVVVPYAADPDRFFAVPEDRRVAARARFGLPPDGVVFGRIGQPSFWKWHPVLLDAFRQVAERRPDVSLFLVGAPPQIRDGVDALPPPVRERVVLRDFLHGDDDLREGYAAMDVFLHAAEVGESFGMVLAEAMLCERPVITMSRPAKDNSQLEVVGHGEGGLVVADGAAMVGAMEVLAGDEDLRGRLGVGGARRVRERFGLEPVMETLLAVAEHSLAADTREALRRRLAEASGLISQVKDAEIRELLHRQEGAPSRREQLQMALAHRPELYAPWARLKAWKHRTFGVPT